MVWRPPDRARGLSRGKFITIEGGDGAGKSTQVDRLCARLAARGIAVRATREPGGSPGADEIRRLLVEGAVNRWDAITELLLHYAARRDHLVRTIGPALAAGEWVVSDRFADSTLAYQGYGHALGADVVDAIHRIVVDSEPDLTILLDVPVGVGAVRARQRGGEGAAEDRYERMDEAFHERVRAGFLAVAEANPGRCVVANATADPEAVAGELWRIVSRRFGLG